MRQKTPLMRPLFFMGLLLIINPNLIQAQPASFQFLDADNSGFPQDPITSILRDHDGLMWFGTDSGLFRYDGHRTQWYQYNPADTTSLSNNQVIFLFEDSRDNFWVGTAGGLNLLNRHTGVFTRLFHTSNDVSSLIDMPSGL